MTAPPYTSDDGNIVYGKCYASYVRSVSDRDGDPDPYPDIDLLSGSVKFESVYDSAGARPALPLPATPRTKGIVISGDTYEVKNSNLVDKEGREGVWLVLSVDDVPLTWRATVTLTDERNRVLLNTAYIVTEDVWEIELDGRHVINLPDLIPNPGALTPPEGSALRSAQQTLDEIRVLKDLIDTSKMDIDNSESSALTYRNQAQGFRNEAETFKNTATTQAGLATTARTGAETARTGAQTARTGAETARTGAETAKGQVDTAKTQIDTTHDHIHQDVTHADTHALAAGAAAQTSIDKALEAGTAAGVSTTKAAEAAQSRADALTFRNTAQGAATTATTKAGEATTAATTATTKAAQTAIDALTLAQRIETGTKELGVTSDGKLYFLDQPVEQVPLRVDTTVGTRVFLGDVMIHGDTGWRNVVSLLDPNNFTLSDVSGYARMRRVGTRVTFVFRIKVLNSPVGSFITTNIPPGLRPAAQMLYIDHGSARATGLSMIAVSNTNTSDKISININLAGIVGETVYGKAEWDADLAWPTSLPGTPA